VEEVTVDNVHKDFRLWLTSMPSKDFPVSVLQNSVKMTNEPPKGLRANLYSTYYKLDDEKLDITTKPYEYKKLLFALSFFHAIVQDRVKFGPLGWNIPYSFNDTDIEISKSQMEMFLDIYDEIPYKVLQFLTNYINYGGRVTDAIDLRTIDVIMRDFFPLDGSVMKDDYKFSQSGLYYSVAVPDEGSAHEAYVEYIESLPIVPDPECFGMHENANIACATTEVFDMLDTTLSLQPRQASGGGLTREEVIGNIAKGIEERMPGKFDIEAIGMKYPTRYEESMNTVLVQECIRYNNLISVMLASLPAVQKALKGLVVMSGELEEMSTALFNNAVPANWENKAYPCLKPLAAWVEECFDRLNFIKEWELNGPPTCFWVSGFYFPQAFFTGNLQNYARKNQFPIDAIEFDYIVMKESKDDVSNKPEDGCYCYGLFMEGARWNPEVWSIDDSLPKELYTLGPLMHYHPVKDRKETTEGVYRMPVYKILSRRGVLATTGHSSNFVMWIEMPSNRTNIINNVKLSDQYEWIKAGVAMFCSLLF